MFDTPPKQVGSVEDREQATRSRLLEAAAEVFSERGFRDATIREICTRAGANVAAVNYHFRDKEGLYVEVLRFADRAASTFRMLQTALAPGSGQDARQRLAAFIRGYVSALVDSGKLAWHNRLIARELLEPSPALDLIVDENIRPRSQLLSAILRELLCGGAPEAECGWVSDELIARCKFSVIGQCMIYHSGRHVVQRLNPALTIEAAGIDEVTEHILDFSLAAIDGLRAQHAGRGREDVR